MCEGVEECTKAQTSKQTRGIMRERKTEITGGLSRVLTRLMGFLSINVRSLKGFQLHARVQSTHAITKMHASAE